MMGKAVLPLFLMLFTPSLFAQQMPMKHEAKGFRILDKILIIGHTRTKDRVILRELNVHTGDTVFFSKLPQLISQNRQRLETLSLFNTVQINWEKIKQDSINMLIKVTDRFPVYPQGTLAFADRNFNTWWEEQNHQLDRINLGLTLIDNNFRGRREKLMLTGQIGYTQKIGISYNIPFIDKAQTQGIGFSLFGLQNKEIAYKTKNNKRLYYRSDNSHMLRRMAASIWYTYRPAYAWEHKVTFTYQHYWINKRADALNPNYLGMGLMERNNLWGQYQVKLNRVDNWNYPLTGQRFIGRANVKLLLPFPHWQASFYAQYDKYLHPISNGFIGFIFRGKYAFPNKQPYIFQQNMGYNYDYVRGFEYYVLDGSSFALGRLDLKYRLLNYDLQLPIRYFEVVPIRLFVKAFGDLGYSYNKWAVNPNLNNRLLYSGGIGIDIVTLYDIKIRFEYTVNSIGKQGLFIHKKGE